MTDLQDFPWVDPADDGYTVEEYDPDTDEAPPGADHDCAGEDEDG